MKIVVVGGAGEVGAEVTRALAATAEVDDLIVADVDADRAHMLVSSLGSGHAAAVGLDVRDRDASLAVLVGADVLMNCTSFVLFDDVIKLAVEARVNYADLISEPCAQHKRSAYEAGITAISGLGATPGLSNVLVRHAAEELGELEEVDISWTSFRTIAPTPGLLDTIAWELSESCDTRVYLQNGRLEQAAAFEGSRLVRFADPVGLQQVYFVPHPEVRTLPQMFPSLRTCAVRGSWRPELMEHMRILGHYGLLSPAAIESTKQRIWERHGGVRDAQPWTLYVNVEITTTRAAGPIRRVYDVSHPIEWGQAGPGRMTGVAAAVGTLLLARNGVTNAGFVDPERYYDPNAFLEELEHCGSISVTWTDYPTSVGRLERLDRARGH